ncbi:MAG: alpha-galactosidase [Lacticaseibacillus rhamnosus]|nr:alpha-galactosidase [Lacticaseibacillus rhamnosus]
MTRSPAQKSTRAQLTITRSPAQKSACKDLERAGQDRAITLEATYTPTSNRAGSRSHFLEVINSRQIYVTM